MTSPTWMPRLKPVLEEATGALVAAAVIFLGAWSLGYVRTPDGGAIAMVSGAAVVTYTLPWFLQDSLKTHTHAEAGVTRPLDWRPPVLSLIGMAVFMAGYRTRTGAGYGRWKLFVNIATNAFAAGLAIATVYIIVRYVRSAHRSRQQ